MTSAGGDVPGGQGTSGDDGRGWHRHLTMLEGWRAFLGHDPDPPVLLDAQARKQLPEEDLLDYDEQRMEYHVRLGVIQTPMLAEVLAAGRLLTMLNREAVSARRGLILSGPAGTGKTTALTQLGKRHEILDQRRHPRAAPGSRIPVVYVTVPPAATPRMLAAEFARFLGLPVTTRANITDIIEAACGVLIDMQASLVLCDCTTWTWAPAPAPSASDTLKYFSERLPVTFVYAGIGPGRGALLAGPRGDQVAGRFTLIPAAAFTTGQEWATLIAALEGILRLCRHKDGTLVTLADCLHRRTRGLIGSLLWLIRDAACQAILDGTEKITRKSPGQVAVDMTAQAPPPRTGSAKR